MGRKSSVYLSPAPSPPFMPLLHLWRDAQGLDQEWQPTGAAWLPVTPPVAAHTASYLAAPYLTATLASKPTPPTLVRVTRLGPCAGVDCVMGTVSRYDFITSEIQASLYCPLLSRSLRASPHLQSSSAELPDVAISVPPFVVTP